MLARLGYQLYAETGLKAWVASPGDTKILCLQRYFRFLAYGGSTLILALYLSSLNVSDQQIGLFMTLTLLGDVLVSLVLTAVADSIGRRRMLAVGALLMTASGIVFALSNNFWILLLASVLGVISPSGNEIGPFKAIEESTISHLTPLADRSSVLAWYIIAGLVGAASGTITFGWTVQELQIRYLWSPLESYRVVFWAYAFVGFLKCCLATMLSDQCEPETFSMLQSQDQSDPSVDETETAPLIPEGEESSTKDDSADRTASHFQLKTLLPSLSPETRGIVVRLCLLFALDSIASGLTPISWISYYFNLKFGLSEGRLGSLFFAANILSSLSNLLAPSLARRLGLIKTMVFTHVPASLALAAIPIPSNSALAMTFFLFRASTNSMDQAPRQAFIAAAVHPQERTAVMGLVNVVKTLSQSAGPAVTGVFATQHMFGLAFIVAGVLKIAYDIFMLAMFLGYRTVEERALKGVDSEIQHVREEDSDGLQEAV